MRILFRLNSSSKIGLGHLMRSLVLASKYKNDYIEFACENLNGNKNSLVLEKGFRLNILSSDNIDELIDLIKDLKIDLLIVDSYDFAYEDEKKIKEQNICKLMVFDDLYEKHYCDVILNHNIYANEKMYKGKVLENTKLLCGSKYTLLRDEFRKKFHFKKPLEYTVMVCLGGTDFDNITLEIAKVLIKFDINIKLITSSSNKNIKSLERLVFLNKNCKLIINSNKMAYEMATSNLAIVSGSGIVNEIAAVNIPFITIITQINQEKMLEYIKKNKMFVLKKFENNQFRKILKKVLP